MGKAGINLNKYRKRYRPLGRWNSKAKTPIVRGVSTFFVTFSKLGQLSLYNFKNLYRHLPQNFNQKFRPFWYCMEFFERIFKIFVKFLFLWNIKNILNLVQIVNFHGPLLSFQPRVQYNIRGISYHISCCKI